MMDRVDERRAVTPRTLRGGGGGALRAEGTDRSNEAGGDEDRRLIERLVARDSTAWAEFVERFQRLVLARVLATARELNHPLAAADADDLCADVFAQLVERDFAALRGFEGRSRLGTWLSVITRRSCLRRLARRWREPSRPAEGAPSDLEVVACPHDDPLATLLRGERHARVRDGLSQLSERDQQLVRSFFIDGSSYREISEQLQMPINSIGPTLQRIQARLRKWSGLADSGDDVTTSS